MRVQFDTDFSSIANISNEFEQDTAKFARVFREKLLQVIKQRTPVDTGAYQFGWRTSAPVVSREAISLTFQSSTRGESGYDYGRHLEEGLYPSVGPRTVGLAGGIYSKQAPGGIIGPLVEEAAWPDAITMIVLEALNEVGWMERKK
jgi:hypothetical protein